MTKEKRVTTTLNCGLDDAEICRRNGWKAGTVLESDDGHVIKITAVGRATVLAVDVLARGKEGHEADWALDCRNWTKAANL